MKNGQSSMEAYHLKDECEQLKELADLVYVCYQFAASQEWDLDEAMHQYTLLICLSLVKMVNLSTEKTVRFLRTKVCTTYIERSNS